VAAEISHLSSDVQLYSFARISSAGITQLTIICIYYRHHWYLVRFGGTCSR